MKLLFLAAVGICLLGDKATASLIGHWKLDDSGTVAADSSGYGRDGTLINNPTWVNHAVSSNGLACVTNAYMSVPHSSAFNATNYTLSVWFKPDGLGGVGPEFSQLMSKGTGITNGWTVKYTDTGKVLFQTRSMWGYSLTSLRVLPTNLWSHVVAVHDHAKSKLLLYIDGQLDSTKWYISYHFTNSSDIAIGKVNGTLDDVRIYDQALSEREVMGLFLQQDQDHDRVIDSNEIIAGTNPTNQDTDNDGATDFEEIIGGTDPLNWAEKPDTTSAITGWWKCDEGTGSTATDSSGNGQTATLIGDTTWVAGVLGPGAGRWEDVGQKLQSAATGIVTGQFTVSAWIELLDNGYGAYVVRTADPVGHAFSMEMAANEDNNWGAIVGKIGRGDSWIEDDAYAPLDWRMYRNNLSNDWFHVVYTVSPTNYAVYFGGVTVASGTYSNDMPVLYDIGRSLTNITFLGGQGNVDDVRFYQRVLTTRQVAVLANLDSDLDGLPNSQETRLGTNPMSADSDGDGLPDGAEIVVGTDPSDSDTDGDGLPDGVDALPTSFDNATPSFTITYPSNGGTIYP